MEEVPLLQYRVSMEAAMEQHQGPENIWAIEEEEEEGQQAADVSQSLHGRLPVPHTGRWLCNRTGGLDVEAHAVNQDVQNLARNNPVLRKNSTDTAVDLHVGRCQN
jgi:hypothetical protein